METIKAPNGHTLAIRAISPAILAAADREMGQGDSLASTLSRSAEVARLLLAAWKDAEDRDMLAGLKPAETRRLLMETPGLMPFIASEGKRLADEAEKGFRADSGN